MPNLKRQDRPMVKGPAVTPAQNVAARKRPAGGEIARLGPEIGKQVQERKAKLGLLKGPAKPPIRKKKTLPVGGNFMSRLPY